MPPEMRIAFRMMVNPGQALEYQRRHNPIWDELKETLLQHGVRSYSIFLDSGTNDLFAYAEIDSEASWEALASTAVCRRWWRVMRDVMPTTGDGRPVSRSLREVFHLECAEGGEPQGRVD